MKRFELVDERVENEKPYEGQDGVYFYYRYQKNQPVLNVKGKKRVLLRENIDPEQSILSQRKDPDQYPEISYLGLEYAKIRIYREWGLGRYTAPRLPQPADRRNDFLEEDCENLGMVLNRLRGNPSVKKTILDGLKRLYDGIDDFEVNVVGGTVQVSVHEGKFAIPATRLSDGTLRYLCLLAILCDPSPPPLICIEEPELGLHPDALTGVADLLKIAAERTQIIVTTHSEILVDEMTDCPESVIVCSKTEGATEMKRLEKKQLEGFLDAYRLGKRWMQGQVGGVRW
jgi:predicted ATPase